MRNLLAHLDSSPSAQNDTILSQYLGQGNALLHDPEMTGQGSFAIVEISLI
jgi:hypothetical protein